MPAVGFSLCRGMSPLLSRPLRGALNWRNDESLGADLSSGLVGCPCCGSLICVPGPRSYRSLRPDHGDDKGRLTAGAAGPVAGQRRVLARRTSMVRSLAKKPSSTHVLLYFFVFLRKTIREPTTFRNTYRKLRYFGQIVMPFCLSGCQNVCPDIKSLAQNQAP